MRVLLAVLVVGQLCALTAARGGGKGRGRGKGKNLLPFGNVAEYSLVLPPQSDNRVRRRVVGPAERSSVQSATIVSGSHFSQTFKLGYKILLICVARGDPRPSINWYKDGSEIRVKPNQHVRRPAGGGCVEWRVTLQFYEERLSGHRLWSKLEIDPATMGDQGIYSCMASNKRGLMAKNFKADYTY